MQFLARYLRYINYIKVNCELIPDGDAASIRCFVGLAHLLGLTGEKEIQCSTDEGLKSKALVSFCALCFFVLQRV